MLKFIKTDNGLYSVHNASMVIVKIKSQREKTESSIYIRVKFNEIQYLYLSLPEDCPPEHQERLAKAILCQIGHFLASQHDYVLDYKRMKTKTYYQFMREKTNQWENTSKQEINCLH